MPKKVLLSEAAPEVFAELLQELNPEVDIDTLASSSSADVKWRCNKGHVWTTKVRNRSKSKTPCPYCSRRRASPEYNLRTELPEVADEWNYERNGELKPEDCLPSSMLKVWWRCFKGHEWEAAINGRNAGNSCPFCSNRKIGYGNDLATKFPEVAREWHPTKNGNLTPSKVAPRSSKQRWWLCNKGHEWRAMVVERVGGTGCPKCRKERNFESFYPELAKEWSGKNEIGPDEVGPKSNKKFWFNCPDGHEYQSSPERRSRGQGCPICAGRIASAQYNFETEYPELAEEWDYECNEKKPSDFTPKSGQLVWWRCKEGHNWQATIGNRSGQGSGCPFCAPTNARAAADTNLEVTNPDLMKEWDWEKNVDFDPKKLKAGSTQKVFWRCAFGHSWEAAIYSRSSGRGCPECRPSISRAEIRLLSEFEAVFPNVEHHARVDGIECDLLIYGKPSIAVEVDGKYWHKDREERDNRKNIDLNKRGVIVVRLRDASIGIISENDVNYAEEDLGPSVVRKLIIKICDLQNAEPPSWLNEYRSANEFREEERFGELSARFPLPSEGKSLAETHPEIAALWDEDANSGLTPWHVTFGSSMEVGWICSEGHKFRRRIGVMTRGSSKCPQCHQRYTGSVLPNRENSFGGKYPELLSSWHERNTEDPFTLAPGSNKEYWFKCPKGHEWKTSLYGRSKYGCPNCAGRKVAADTSLEYVAPAVAGEWASDLNNGVEPRDITIGTKKIKPWWRCGACGHVWQAATYDRVRKRTGCPKCGSRPEQKSYE